MVKDLAGLIRVGPRFQLEIAPKFLGDRWSSWREDFFFLATISRHGRLFASDRLPTGVGAANDLSTLVARAIVTLYWDNARRPLRTYRDRHIVDFGLDGEADIADVVLPSADGILQRAIRFERENPYNAAILKACETLLPGVRDQAARQQLARVAQLLRPQVQGRGLRTKRVPSRSNGWQPLLDLCLDVAEGFGVVYGGRANAAPGYVVKTWQMWEDLLSVALRAGFGTAVDFKKPYVLGQRRQGDAVTAISVWPDIGIAGRQALIVDAKYKTRAQDGAPRIAEADIYEALAYALASERKRVLLLYPRSGALELASIGAVEPFEHLSIQGVEVVGAQCEVRGIAAAHGFREFVAGLSEGVKSIAGKSVTAN